MKLRIFMSYSKVYQFNNAQCFTPGELRIDLHVREHCKYRTEQSFRRLSVIVDAGTSFFFFFSSSFLHFNQLFSCVA